MAQNPIAVVQAVFAAMERNDRLMMMALFAEDFAFTFNADPDRIGDGTTLVGWTANRAHLDRVQQTWEQLDRKVLSMREDAFRADQVNVRISFSLRHRASGEIFEGTKRQSWTVRDGIVISMVEVFDQASVHAVQRLAASSAEPPTRACVAQAESIADGFKDR